jgi:hydrogenase expression/formation protein HypE
LWLTWALILEEGAQGALVDTCLKGTARAASEAGVSVVAGDTKVVPRGKGDRIYAVTAGVGVVPPGRDLGDHRVQPGDVVLVSGPIGDHGATIMACRHDLGSDTLRSDCAPLNSMVEALADTGVALRSLHDPTRGGVLTVCNEVAERASVRIVLDESAIPIRREVQAVCELLGMEPLSLACEGRSLAWVSARDAHQALEALRAHPLGRDAAIIGRVKEKRTGEVPVVLKTKVGGLRPLDLLSGTDLPRIC